jgi:hypothetical protein
MTDAQTNPLLPADFIVPSPESFALLLGRCFHIGWPLYKQTQRVSVRILGSVPFKHQFAAQQLVAPAVQNASELAAKTMGRPELLTTRLTYLKMLLSCRDSLQIDQPVNDETMSIMPTIRKNPPEMRRQGLMGTDSRSLEAEIIRRNRSTRPAIPRKMLLAGRLHLRRAGNHPG